MKDSNNPFKKAGLSLLSVGIIDIAVMVYCYMNEISYSSSFYIFALIAGALLLRGGVKTARVVRWLSALFAMAFIGLLIAMPISLPLDLLITQLKLDALSIIGPLALGFIIVGVLIWVHFQLNSPDSLTKIAQAGYKTGKPMFAYMMGAAFLIFVLVSTSGFQDGDQARQARMLAREKLGSDFHYHVSNMTTSGDSNHAVVTAYTDNNIQTIEVEW